MLQVVPIQVDRLSNKPTKWSEMITTVLQVFQNVNMLTVPTSEIARIPIMRNIVNNLLIVKLRYLSLERTRFFEWRSSNTSDL